MIRPTAIRPTAISPTVIRLIASALLVALAATAPVEACGPYPFDTRFWYDHRAGVAEHRVIRGELGIFEPGYDSAWIFSAWRQLAGPGLVESDHEKLIWLVSPDYGNFPSDSPSGTRDWDEAREAVMGEGVGWLDTTREQSSSDDGQRTWVWFDNCLADAFETAAETLRVRASEYGNEHLAVGEWVRGQDAVFENCSGGQVDPEPASEDWPVWLQKDRAYQRAAAALYSERYDEAVKLFADIAQDSDSPWRVVSGYLVGRALAREGRHDEAIEQYRAVLGDPEAAEYHASARGLIDHLLFRHDPAALRAEVVARLSAEPLPDTVAQDLVDFHRLARGAEAETLEKDADPLTDWYRSVKGWNSPGEVVDRWRAEKDGDQGPAWRWAALLRANATEIVFDDGREYEALPPEAIDELLAAETFEPGDTGAVSEAYHRARLLLDVGRTDEAIPILESAVQGEYGSVSTAETNLILAQRLRGARRLDEIVRFGQMYPTEVGWNYDDNEPLAGDEDVPTWNGGPVWHLTATKSMNGLSARTLSALVTPESVTDELLRAQTLRVAWTRAVTLEDEATAADLARRLAEIDETLAPQLEPLLSAPGVERAFLASLVILRHPGLHPDLHWGVSRPTAIDELDVYYSDWWCQGDTFDLPEFADLEALGAASSENLDALRRLEELPSAPIWLGQKVLDYADAHPDDARVPEALHRVVRATRHGCEWGTDGFGEISQSAFQRLHQRYSGNEWTEKTPYWFD